MIYISLIFLSILMMLSLFLCLLFYIFYGEIDQIFCLFALLLLNFRDYLYILDDNCFSNMWFPNLFYHFYNLVCCLFTLYILFLWILIYLFYFYWCLWCYYVFFKSFIALGLTLKYLGLFWVDFCGVRVWFPFFYMWISSFPRAKLVEKILLFLRMVLTLFLKSFDNICKYFISLFYGLSVCLWLGYYYTILISPVTLESRSVNLPVFGLYFYLSNENSTCHMRHSESMHQFCNTTSWESFLFSSIWCGLLCWSLPFWLGSYEITKLFWSTFP